MIKICKMHGELTPEQVYFRTNGKLLCKECIQIKNKNKYERDRAKRLQQAAVYREANRGRCAEWARNDRKQNPDKYKLGRQKIGKHGYSRMFKNKIDRYSLAIARYHELYKLQNGLCAICKMQETYADKNTGKIDSLSIDHCHKSNNIRGLLCRACNSMIGCFKDNTETMQKAIAYLIKHGEAA